MRSHLPDFELVVARDMTEALSLLAGSESWRPVAGATDLMVLFNAGRLPYRKLFSIAALPELTSIAVSVESIAIGAAVNFSVIRHHPILQAEFPLLSQAASWTGGVANQNRGTIGGNIANASPAADSSPPLLVYDAELELISQHGSRRIPYHQFHTGYKAMQIRPNELILRIHLPRTYRKLHQYARKVGARKTQAISKVCFNAAAELDSSVIKHIRIAVGSVAPIPLRCYKVEAALAGETLSKALVNHARDVVLEEIQPIDDIRSTSEYRTLVTQNLLGEFLERLL
jgi:CO/xanthine dehydrogenase FAD-binding subunit